MTKVFFKNGHRGAKTDPNNWVRAVPLVQQLILLAVVEEVPLIDLAERAKLNYHTIFSWQDKIPLLSNWADCVEALGYHVVLEPKSRMKRYDSL